MAKEEIWRTARFLKNDGTLLVFSNYEVSNMGRVRSLKYCGHAGKVKLMKLEDSIKGYYLIGFTFNHKYKKYSVHRLVASTFLEIPEDPKMYESVNHRDENKHNNNISNLEWCTNKYNANYGTSITRRVKKQLNQKATSKPILQINPETLDIITEYPSTHEAERTLGICKRNISNAIRHNWKAGGFYWRYK